MKESKLWINVISNIEALTYSFVFKFDAQTQCFFFPMAAATYNNNNNNKKPL